MKKKYIIPLVNVVKLNNHPLLAAVSGEIEGETSRQFSMDTDFEEFSEESID